jgi:hypothetical protein
MPSKTLTTHENSETENDGNRRYFGPPTMSGQERAPTAATIRIRSARLLRSVIRTPLLSCRHGRLRWRVRRLKPLRHSATAVCG